MRLTVVVFAWWFAFTGSYRVPPAVMGPFIDNAQCESIRGSFEKARRGLDGYLTWCWWDGKN